MTSATETQPHPLTYCSTWGWVVPLALGAALAASCGGKATDQEGGASAGDGDQTIGDHGDGDGDFGDGDGDGDIGDGDGDLTGGDGDGDRSISKLSAACAEADSLDVVLLDRDPVTVLAEVLWGTGPDDELLERADSVITRGDLYELALEMLSDARTFDGAANFVPWWVTLERDPSYQAKNPDLFPEHSMESHAAMVDEARYFGAWILDPENGLGYDTLVTGGVGFAGEHDWVYGDESSGLMFERPERFGAFSLPLFAAATSYPEQTAPAARGQMVRWQLLCGEVPAPPVDISPVFTDYEAPMRDWWDANVNAPECASCHVLVGQLGLGFEQFDPVGQYRTTEDGHEIDPATLLASFEEPQQEIVFDEPREMMEYLSESPAAWECMGAKWFEFYFGDSGRHTELGQLDVDGLVLPLVACAADSGAYSVSEFAARFAVSDAVLRSHVCGPHRCLGGEVCQLEGTAESTYGSCLGPEEPLNCGNCECIEEDGIIRVVDCRE